jgi:formate hydrogenlyase transcriptional activator
MSYVDLLAVAVAASPDGFIVFDGSGDILFANDAVHQMFGYERGALLGTSLDALVRQPVRETHSSRSLRQRLFSDRNNGGTRTDRILEGRRKDGSRFPIEVGLTPTADEGASFGVATIVDLRARRSVEQELAIQNEFERLIAEIAAGFAAVSPDKEDEAIVESQRRLAEFLGVERSSLWQPVDDRDDEFVYTHVWRADPTVPLPESEHLLAGAHFPWVLSRLRDGEIVAFASVDEVPSEIDRDSYRRVGSRSAVSIPLITDGKLIGFISFGTLTFERAWSPHTLDRLQLLGSVVANSLSRRRAHQSLQSALAEVQRLREQLALENVQLRREVRTLKGPRVIAAESVATKQVLAQIEQVAPTTATVLMLGETGCGKEVFAEAIHELSPRRSKPMVRVNCAAIPTALIESELFGRERGAYTGALSRQIGRFEVGDGSTIFLDELGDLPLEVQVKLLRVLQDRVIERLGSSQQIKVNVRVIAATNRDLEQAVADHAFREDLYYRLNVFPIRVPPLRERVEDVPTLVWTFIDEFSRAFGKNIESLSKSSLEALQNYSWPGNVRELRNVIERAVIVATGPRLIVEPPRPSSVLKRKSLKFVDVEVDHIRSVLEATRWRVRGRGGAADLLGMKPTTLESRMAKLGIVRIGRHTTDRATAAHSVRPRPDRYRDRD